MGVTAMTVGLGPRVAANKTSVGASAVAAAVPAANSARGVPPEATAPQNRERFTLLRAERGSLLGVAGAKSRC